MFAVPGNPMKSPPMSAPTAVFPSSGKQDLDAELVEDFCRAYLQVTAVTDPPSAITAARWFPSGLGLPSQRPVRHPAAAGTAAPLSMDCTSEPGKRERQGSPLPRDPRPGATSIAPVTARPHGDRLNRGHKVCKSFRLYGSCRFGSRCLYHHAVAEGRSADLNIPDVAIVPLVVTPPAVPEEHPSLRRDDTATTEEVSLSVSAATTSEHGVSFEGHSVSTGTTVSLSPTMPHPAEGHSDKDDSGEATGRESETRASHDDADGKARADEHRWDALRLRAVEKAQGTRSLAGTSSGSDVTVSKSPSGSGSDSAGPRLSSASAPPPDGRHHSGSAVLCEVKPPVGGDEAGDLRSPLSPKRACPAGEATAAATTVPAATRADVTADGQLASAQRQSESQRGMCADATPFVPAMARTNYPVHPVSIFRTQDLPSLVQDMLSVPSIIASGKGAVWCAIYVQPLPLSPVAYQGYGGMVAMPAGPSWSASAAAFFPSPRQVMLGHQ